MIAVNRLNRIATSCKCMISFIDCPKDLGLNEGVRNSHHQRELTFKWNDENYSLLLDLNMLTPYCVAVIEMTNSILRIT